MQSSRTRAATYMSMVCRKQRAEERKALTRSMRKRGMTAQQIALALNLSDKTIYRYLLELEGTKVGSDSERKRCVELYGQGYTQVAIARHLKRSVSTISNWINRAYHQPTSNENERSRKETA